MISASKIFFGSFRVSKKAQKRNFPILAYKGHIVALGLAREAGAGLIWVEFNLVMPQQAPIRWTLNSWAAQANHGHPTIQ